MRQAIFTKLAATTAIALGTLGVGQTAYARTDVYFSVGVPAPAYAPPVYEVVPAPVYEPQPVYVAPPTVYAAPAEVYVRPSYDDWRWRREAWRREQWRRWQYAHRHYWDGRDWD